MSRQCQCGGVIRSHPLTENREAWSCKACGRYEAVQRDAETESQAPEKQDDNQGGEL
jgi:hypothetical protein